jgi:hypothetical protein
MTNQQLYLAIGIPLIVSVLGFTLVGMMLFWLKGDIRDVNSNLNTLTTKVIELMVKIEHLNL